MAVPGVGGELEAAGAGAHERAGQVLTAERAGRQPLQALVYVWWWEENGICIRGTNHSHSVLELNYYY